MANQGISASIQPGYIFVESLAITSPRKKDKQLDISRIIQEINIYENINQPFMTANMFIHDVTSLFTIWPLIGDETIDVKFNIPHSAFQVPFEKKFRIIGIQEVTPTPKVREARYILRCILPEAFNDFTKSIRKSYADIHIHEMAESLFDEFLKIEGGDGIQVKETEGLRTLVIPNLSPSEAIQFFAREAKSTTYSPSNFVFFSNANKNGFYFTTVEELLTKLPRDQYYLTEKNYMPKGPLAQKEGPQGRGAASIGQKPIEFLKVIDYKIRNVFDLENNLVRGAFDNTVMYIDPASHLFDLKKYNYMKDYSNFKRLGSGGGVPGKFIAEPSDLANLEGESHQRFIITNKESEKNMGDKKWEFLHEMAASVAMLDYISLDLTIPGDCTKRVGETIRINFPEFSGFDSTLDKLNHYIAGDYLVAGLRHMFNPRNKTGYVTVLQCVKNSYYRDPGTLEQITNSKPQ